MVVFVHRQTGSGSIVVSHALVDYKRFGRLYSHFLDCKRKQNVLSLVPRVIFEIVVFKLDFEVIRTRVISLIYEIFGVDVRFIQ